MVRVGPVRWGGEDALVVASQRVAVDGFDGHGALVGAVELAAALGVAHVGPVGGLIGGAGEPAGVDEGLDERAPAPPPADRRRSSPPGQDGIPE